MGYFYFDESIQSRAQFVLGAFAYSEVPLESSVANALQSCGLRPRVDEFKSGCQMNRNPGQVAVRKLLNCVIQDHCRIGLVVTPHTLRPTLGNEAMMGLNKILRTNLFRSPTHDVFFDEGIFPNSANAVGAARKFCDFENCRFHFEQSSITVVGLQVADLIAHGCGTMLLAQLGLHKKMVKAGPNSGYDPEMDMELEFELWAGLRYNFFAASPPPVEAWKSQLDFQVDVKSRGLHIADSCESWLRDAAITRFGRMYLGCIH